MRSIPLTNFPFMKHLLTLYCVRYQECIISYYSSISMIYICPYEQHGRTIMKLGKKKWLHCKWVVYTFSWTRQHFLLILLSISHFYIFFLFLLFCTLLASYHFFFLYVLSASFSLLVWSSLSHLKEDNKNNINNKKSHDSLRVLFNPGPLQLKVLKEE